MNKKIFVILGIILIIVVVLAWLYLVLTGKTANNDDTFARFNAGGSNGDVIIQDDFDDNNPVVDNGPPRLRKLTSRPVAGAVFTDLGMMFVEQGTGHVYNLNLTTGNETLLSGTTLAGARGALFSDKGEYVAITHERSGFEQTIVGSVTADSILEGVALPEGATEMHFSEKDGGLFYLLSYEKGSRGYFYDIESAGVTELFDVPLRDIRVVWGDTVYVYTTPSSAVEGYVYEVNNNALEYVTTGGVGLLAQMSPAGLLVTVNSFEKIISYSPHDDSFLFGTLIPEKCSSLNERFVCAVPAYFDNEPFPDDWYKGLISYSDSLWEIDFESGGASLIVDLLEESGQSIDISHVGLFGASNIYFINKNDNSLWLFSENI